MSAPTIFISAATIDLQPWRDVLHDAFSRAGFHVYTQKHSLGAATGDVHRLLTQHIRESQCVIHLAGMSYGADADLLDPAFPDFQCSWTQFEYYYAHQQGIDVIAFVCAPELSEKFTETGKDAADIARKIKLQMDHRERVASGGFDGTPLAGKVKRTFNEQVDSAQSLLKAVLVAVGSMHKQSTPPQMVQALQAVQQDLTLRQNLHQLPPNPRLSGFVGREKDLEILRHQPTTGAVLTGLRGMGGIGKTALGLVLAYEWSAQFPDAQFWLDGQGTHAVPTTPESLLAKVIQTYHPTAQLPAELPALLEIYRQVLSGQRVLIVLDNAKDAAQAKPLIPPAGCGFIVTSRNNILLGTKAAYSVDRLLDADAAALLREYHANLTDAHAAALIKLCAGLPLTLRLAGAHLALDASERGGVPDVAGYLQKLQSSRLGTLDADAPDANEITISETLRLSEAQLLPAEQTAWRNLSVFASSFDARAAEAIAGADETILHHLVRRSLLDRDGTDRYKLHDLAAEYAQGKLTPVALDALRMRHSQHFTAVGAETDDLYLAGNPIAGLALFDREREQIQAAYTWLDGQPGESAARQMIALVNSIAYTGQSLRFHPRQRITWLESQLRAARVAKHGEAEGGALGNLGLAYAGLGDARKAIEYHEQALIVLREIGDRRGEGSALGNLGNAHRQLGDARKAIEYYEQQLAITREIGDRRGEGNALGNLGNAYAALGDTRKAIGFYEQRMVIAREIGDRHGEGRALASLGNAYVDLGDARKAIEYHEQALVTSNEIGDRREAGKTLGNLGFAYAALGDVNQAINLLNEALIISRELGDRRGESNALANIGRAQGQLGNSEKAIECFKLALEIAREMGDQRGEGTILNILAMELIKLGKRNEAISLNTAALEVFRTISDPQAQAVEAQLAYWTRTSLTDPTANMSTKEAAAYAEGVRRIESCRKSGASSLFLCNLGLTQLPTEIVELTGLRVLDLTDNALSALPSEIGQLTSLTHLFLHGNPDLGLSDELLGPPRPLVLADHIEPKPPAEILSAYFRIAGTEGEPLGECKVIVVGRGGAGKTSLVKRLSGRPYDRNEPETHGIQILQIPFTGVKGHVLGRVWDFGGQVVLHSMHEFFFTERSLYVLVLGERDDMLERDAVYWLQLIRSYAGAVPVVVALNKSAGRHRSFDRNTLETKYGPILGWVPTECSDPDDEKSGIAELTRTLTKALDSQHMDSVRRKFPRKWSAIKAQLEEMSESFLAYSDFQKLCQVHGETDEHEQLALAGDLHDLGVALNYGRDPRLRDTTVLQPDWLANGIYAVLRANDRDDNILPPLYNRALAPDGRITPESLAQIHLKAACWKMLDPADYPKEKRLFLMRLMDLFHLSYPLDESPAVQLIPTLLPPTPPEGAEEPEGDNAVRLRYEFQVVPAPLIPWFIARTFSLIPDRLHWSRGTRLVYGDATGQVWMTQDERYIYATVTGPIKDRDRLLAVIRGTLHKIYQEYKALSPTEQWNHKENWVPTATLVEFGALPPSALPNLRKATQVDLIFDSEDAEEVEL